LPICPIIDVMLTIRPPAFFDHLVDEKLGAVIGPVEIDGQHLLPGELVHLHEGVVGVDARIVDEDVKVAE
jgi:hypothetical protein